MSEWVVDRGFAEVEAAGLREGLWRTVRQGCWRHQQGIMVLEARAAVKGVERFVCGAYGHDVRQLFLIDNMSLVLCLCRGRSRNFGVLVQMRRF